MSKLYIKLREVSGGRSEAFQKLFERPDFIPHVTDARHTETYPAGFTDLHYPEDSVFADIVRFYSDLKKVRNQIEGLLHAGFKTILIKGKTGTINAIYQTCRSCERLGIRFLGKMEFRYSSIGQVRRRDLEDGRLGQTTENLSKRMVLLESNLDRVRSK